MPEHFPPCHAFSCMCRKHFVARPPFWEVRGLRSLPHHVPHTRTRVRRVCAPLTSFSRRDSGGYCGGVPPLPIPNREVKPASADGTAMQCGRVGRRLLFKVRVPRSLTCGPGVFMSGRLEGRPCLPARISRIIRIFRVFRKLRKFRFLGFLWFLRHQFSFFNPHFSVFLKNVVFLHFNCGGNRLSTQTIRK